MAVMENVDSHAPSAMRRLVSSRLARQAALFTGASVLASILSLVATAIVARNVSANAFGAFAFAVALLAFVAMFFEFGVYSAAARMAALEPSARRRIVGSALLLYVPIGIAFVVVAIALIPLADVWLDAELGSAFLVAAALGIAYPFMSAGQELARGIDRLHVASVGNVVAPFSFVALLGGLAVFHDFSAGHALIVRSVALLAAGALIAVWLRPSFERMRQMSAEIVRQARDYGFHVYVGRILSIGTFNMDVLLVGAWATTEEVGYYALAVAIAGGAGLPVIALATALFARMAVEARIDRRWLILSTAVGAALSLVAYLVAGTFVDAVFSDRYRDVVPLLVPLLAAQVVRGTTSIYNTYLSAHGRGRELRNAGLVLTASNLVLNFALIPPYGAMGAAWASLVALVANLIAHIVFYRRSLRLLEPAA